MIEERAPSPHPITRCHNGATPGQLRPQPPAYRSQHRAVSIAASTMRSPSCRRHIVANHLSPTRRRRPQPSPPQPRLTARLLTDRRHGGRRAPSGVHPHTKLTASTAACPASLVPADEQLVGRDEAGLQAARQPAAAAAAHTMAVHASSSQAMVCVTAGGPTRVDATPDKARRPGGDSSHGECDGH